MSRDALVASASMIPEPHRKGHMATITPSISRQFVVFWVARESLTAVDP
jgi:hypothetical protein